MKAHPQPLRASEPSRLVKRAPCIAPESIAPTGCAILYILIRKAISWGIYHWLRDFSGPAAYHSMVQHLPDDCEIACPSCTLKEADQEPASVDLVIGRPDRFSFNSLPLNQVRYLEHHAMIKIYKIKPLIMHYNLQPESRTLHWVADIF